MWKPRRELWQVISLEKKHSPVHKRAGRNYSKILQLKKPGRRVLPESENDIMRKGFSRDNIKLQAKDTPKFR